MITADWKAIPGRLADAGFAVTYDRVSYDPKHPLWSVKAAREGREWNTLGETLGAAFLELEKQTREIASGGGEFHLPETPGKNLAANLG